MLRVSHASTGHYPSPLHAQKRVDSCMLFAVEGALLQLFSSINGFGNNLFATELGATDMQIGLIQTVPNGIAVIFLLPLGILAERLRSSRTIPLVMLLCISAGFALMASVPSFGSLRIPVFFVALGFSVGGTVLYNAQWQTFFGDVVEPDSRNSVLTMRNRFLFALGILTPLVCSMAMRGVVNTLGMYRVFFMICAVAALFQAATVSAIHPPLHTGTVRRFCVQELGDAVRQMAGSRQFLLFFIPVVLFYITWQMDWSMWYIGQVQYLRLTESQMTLYSGIFNIGQLVAIGVLSRMVTKRGTDRTLPFAALSLMFCPLTMMLCTRIPQESRMVVFTVLVTVLNAAQCATNLCLVQILLRVVPQSCRSIAVSLYTLTITLLNCFMPFLGVQLYTAMGADYRALMLFNLIVFLGRAFTFALLLWRCRFVTEK